MRDDEPQDHDSPVVQTPPGPGLTCTVCGRERPKGPGCGCGGENASRRAVDPKRRELPLTGLPARPAQG